MPPTIFEPADVEISDGHKNVILRLIKNHYGNTTNEKSAEQIKKEANVLPGIKFNRWFCMPAAILVQFCVGSVYAWSVFNKPIDILVYGQVVNRAPITFTIAIGFLGFSAAVMGPWLERRGPKIACLLGSSLFFIGNIVTAGALYLQQMWLVFIGYGMIGGFGIGLCYISPVSALQKWFPDHRGLASGIAVCGFGAGSIAMAKVQIPLIRTVGLPLTFVILGVVYFVVMVTAAHVLRTPPPGFKVSGTSDIVLVARNGCTNVGFQDDGSPADLNLDPKSHTESALGPKISVGAERSSGDLDLDTRSNISSTSNHDLDLALGSNKKLPPLGFKGSLDVAVDIGFENRYLSVENEKSTLGLDPGSDKDINLMDALTSRDFRLMYVMFLANIIFGLVLISRLSNMVTDIFERTPEEASTVVSINGGFNLAGRLIFSISSDYIGRKNCYAIMLTTQLIILAVFSTITTTKTYWAFLMTMWALTSCYGAGFSVIPAFLSDKFGPTNIGACHGVILTAWSIAGVAGGLIFTAVFNTLTNENGGYSTKEPFPYNVNAWWILVVVFIGWLAMSFVKPTKGDSQILRKPLEIVRRCCN